jgi:hypothetical protein
LTGTAIVSPSVFHAAGKFSSMLDHILLGCSNLDDGLVFVEQHTGVRAAFGGVHPDRGTVNALLSLGEGHYLEIIAPDPNAKSVQPWANPMRETLSGLKSPRLINWAAHTRDIEGLAKKLQESDIPVLVTRPGSRRRPDGSVLLWKSFNLADDHHGVLPFFIEWDANSLHPSVDAPAGCKIDYFAAADQKPFELSKIFRLMEIDVQIESAEKPQLRARIAGPKGTLEVSS